MIMNFTLTYTIVPDGAYDTIIGYDTPQGLEVTEAILRVSGVSLTSPVRERHTIALLQDINPILVDTACLFQALIFDRAGATVSEIAEVLGISNDLVRDLLEEGEIVGWRVKRRIVVSTRSVEQYLDENPY